MTQHIIRSLETKGTQEDWRYMGGRLHRQNISIRVVHEVWEGKENKSQFWQSILRDALQKYRLQFLLWQRDFHIQIFSPSAWPIPRIHTYTDRVFPFLPFGFFLGKLTSKNDLLILLHFHQMIASSL